MVAPNNNNTKQTELRSTSDTKLSERTNLCECVGEFAGCRWWWRCAGTTDTGRASRRGGSACARPVCLSSSPCRTPDMSASRASGKGPVKEAGNRRRRTETMCEQTGWATRRVDIEANKVVTSSRPSFESVVSPPLKVFSTLVSAMLCWKASEPLWSYTSTAGL